MAASSPSGLQVEEMLKLNGWNGRSLLASAAFRGDKATFEAVLTAVQTRLPPEEVRRTLSASRTAGGVLA